MMNIDELEEKLADMKAQFATIQNDMNTCCQTKSTHAADVKTDNELKSSLDQNVPNPFNNETKIGFNIVDKYVTAFVGVYDLNGRQVMQIPVEQGSNYVMFSGENMQAGMYVYSLVVDKQIVDSKRMIISE